MRFLLPFSSRGGEGELEHQLRDVAVAIAWIRCLEQKLRNAKLLQYQFFNTPGQAFDQPERPDRKTEQNSHQRIFRKLLLVAQPRLVLWIVMLCGYRTLEQKLRKRKLPQYQFFKTQALAALARDCGPRQNFFIFRRVKCHGISHWPIETIFKAITFEKYETEQVIACFDAERQALAMMDHPNIARVLEAGTTESGRPYFVMELVRGLRITEYCDQHHLSAGQRLELFVQVCQAVQHAHHKGVIHAGTARFGIFGLQTTSRSRTRELRCSGTHHEVVGRCRRGW